MPMINPNELPLENYNLFKMIRRETGGNVSAFAKKIGVNQQMVDMLLKPDKKTGKYRQIFPSVKKAVAEFYNISESWIYDESDERESGKEQPNNAIGGDCLEIINKLLNQINELTEINSRNSQTIERLINTIIKDENIK